MLSRSRLLAALLLTAFGQLGALDMSSTVEGIALSTHRSGGSDAGPGVNPAMFGDLVRHDIKDSKVTASKVLVSGKTRGAVISQRGDRVAYIKLDGRLWVVNMDGSKAKELTNAKNHNASALDWPVGDWIYYSENGKWPTGDWYTGESKDAETYTIRRVNATTGEDEFVGKTSENIWQLSLSANADGKKGRFTVTGYLADFADPARKLNDRFLACGTAVSPSGSFVSEMLSTHSDFRIYDWTLGSVQTTVHINEFQPTGNDGRVSMYRPRWSVNSEHWLVFTQGADFGCTHKTNAVLYNWRDRKQIQLTSNPPKSEDSDEGDDFWLKGVANDLAEGVLEGKAPFTVKLGTASEPGQWAWDFGDGKTTAAMPAEHTYAKPGTFQITATQKDRKLCQTVRVLEKTPPDIANTTLLDDQHVLIEFKEPIQVMKGETFATDDPAVTIDQVDHKDGTARLCLRLSQGIAKDTTIKLTPVRDLAQVPNSMAKPAVLLSAAEWPTNHAKLAFIWKTSKSYNRIWNPAIDSEMRIGTFVWEGISTFDRNGAMDCQGGNVKFHAEPVDRSKFPFTSTQETVAAVCSDAFTIEAQITTADLGQGSDNTTPIVSLAKDDNQGTLWLGQHGADLVLKFNSESGMQGPITVHRFSDTARHHVVVSYEPGKLTTYVDGRAVGAVLPTATGKPRLATDAYMIFANQGWHGTLEGIAIYGRPMPAKEAEANCAAYLKTLKTRIDAPSLTITATLGATTRIKAVSEIAPYDDAFVINEYKVVKVVKGEYTLKKIRVAQWGVVRKVIQPINRAGLGSTQTLVLEKMSDNPQLEKIFKRDTLPDDFDLPLYVQVAPEGKAGK